MEHRSTYTSYFYVCRVHIKACYELCTQTIGIETHGIELKILLYIYDIQFRKEFDQIKLKFYKRNLDYKKSILANYYYYYEYKSVCRIGHLLLYLYLNYATL